jgi:ribonuclease D
MKKPLNDLSSVIEDILDSDLDRFRAAGLVAVDCEMTGLNPHRDLLALVQVGDQEGFVRLVRQRDWHNARNLIALLADPQVIKIFHFAIMDCAFILTHLGVETANPYCTKIASKIGRTYTEEHSLSGLVKEFFGIEMNKSEQSTFWLADQLSAKQLTYAAQDVLYLIDLRERLNEIIVKKGNLPTGISYADMNEKCQSFIPSLVHLWVNGWDFGRENHTAAAIFGR